MKSNAHEVYLLDTTEQSVLKSHQQQQPIDYAGEEALNVRYQECHNSPH